MLTVAMFTGDVVEKKNRGHQRHQLTNKQLLTRPVKGTAHLSRTNRKNSNHKSMAKDITIKENAVADALRRLKDEEADLLTRLKPVQEAINALEKIVDKSAKKTKPAKENAAEQIEEVAELSEAE
jgi:hypothetical protein